MSEPPLRAGVGDPEAFALGVALRFAAGFGAHHREIATVIEGVTHAFFEKSGLESAPAHFGDRRSAGE